MLKICNSENEYFKYMYLCENDCKMVFSLENKEKIKFEIVEFFSNDINIKRVVLFGSFINSKEPDDLF